MNLSFRSLSEILYAMSLSALSFGEPVFPFNLPSKRIVKRMLPGHSSDDIKPGFQNASELILSERFNSIKGF